MALQGKLQRVVCSMYQGFLLEVLYFTHNFDYTEETNCIIFFHLKEYLIRLIIKEVTKIGIRVLNEGSLNLIQYPIVEL